jgi:hypothetical protein
MGLKNNFTKSGGITILIELPQNRRIKLAAVEIRVSQVQPPFELKPVQSIQPNQ